MVHARMPLFRDIMVVPLAAILPLLYNRPYL